MENSDMATKERSTEAVESPSLPIHPLYCFADGDVILLTSDGFCFKIHKIVLRLASNFFNSILVSPQNSQIFDTDSIQVEETCNYIKIALDIIYPDRAAEPVKSLEMALMLIKIADKYEMKKVKETVWGSVTHKRFLCGPLETFVIACRCGLEEDIKRASTATLDVNVYDSDFGEILGYLDDSRRLQLYLLHINRRQTLLRALNISYYSINNPDETCMFIRVLYNPERNTKGIYHTSECVRGGFSHPSWLILKYFISVEMDKCSSGAIVVAEDFWARPLIQDLWDLPCARCGLSLFYKEGLISEVKRIFRLLPRTV